MMAALFRDIEASLMVPKPLTVPQVSLGSTGANTLQSKLLILTCMTQVQLKDWCISGMVSTQGNY